MTTYRVLYVDDDPDIRGIAEMSLGLDPQFEVKTCSSGRECLAVAGNWRPDLVLLDVMMPEMDGPQTLRHLKADDELAKTPIVFITARAQQQEVDQFLELGAEGVIPKPFDPMTLAEQARGFLKDA